MSEQILNKITDEVQKFLIIQREYECLVDINNNLIDETGQRLLEVKEKRAEIEETYNKIVEKEKWVHEALLQMQDVLNVVVKKAKK